MIELKNNFELCNIQSLEIPKCLLFGKIIELALFSVDGTFSCFQCFKEYIYKADVVTQFCSDHSPILFALDMIQEGQMRKGLWKLNNFLLSYGLSHEKSCSSHHNFSKRGKYIR